MSQLQNQFAQSEEKGLLSFGKLSNSMPVIIDASQSSDLVPGQPVKIYDSTSKQITVVALAVDTDAIFGYVPYIRGRSSFAAGDSIEIAQQGDVIYLEVGAAVIRGAKVMPVITGSKIITATVGKSIAGFALDKASTDGDLIRVLLNHFSEQAIAGTAGNVAALTGALTGVTDEALEDIADIALSTSNTYTDAAVNSAVNTAILAANLQNKEMLEKQNEVIAALIAAGLMSP